MFSVGSFVLPTLIVYYGCQVFTPEGGSFLSPLGEVTNAIFFYNSFLTPLGVTHPIIFLVVARFEG